MAYHYPNDSCAKGPVTYCLDELSLRDDAWVRLDALRNAVIDLKDQDYRGLEKVFAKKLFNHFYNKEQIKKITGFLKTFWFDEKTGWWPSFQPVAPVYAEGLLKALNASLHSDKPLPFDSYWIIGHSQVELLTLVSKRQVTLLIATPQPIESAPGGVWSESSKAWVTARRAGKSLHEVDPTDNDKRVSGTTDFRLRTFKIVTHKPKKP